MILLELFNGKRVPREMLLVGKHKDGKYLVVAKDHDEAIKKYVDKFPTYPGEEYLVRDADIIDGVFSTTSYTKYIISLNDEIIVIV